MHRLKPCMERFSFVYYVNFKADSSVFAREQKAVPYREMSDFVGLISP